MNHIKALLADNDNKFPSYAWPGGYPIFYVCKDNGVLCPTCANDNRKLVDAAKQDNDPQWDVVAADVNYEDDSLYCDNCSQRIESAYAEPDEATQLA